MCGSEQYDDNWKRSFVIGPYMQEDDWVTDNFEVPRSGTVGSMHDHDSIQNTKMLPVHEYIDKNIM